jgi:hypothetical protein
MVFLVSGRFLKLMEITMNSVIRTCTNILAAGVGTEKVGCTEMVENS